VTVLVVMVFCHLLVWDVYHAYVQSEPSLAEQQPPQRPTPLPLPGAESYSGEGPSDFTTLLQAALPRFRIDPNSIPALFQEQVRKRLQDFALLYNVELQAMFQRARPHLPMIKLILQQQNVPSYFAFLPLVESAFQHRAERQDTGARGLWQLLPDTARTYGLHVSPDNDDRLHPARSTQAAARYLRELHDMFGTDSPLLILAAYNFGEQNLAKAIVRARTRDVWALCRKGQLPLQTRDYLVKMVAFWVLIAHAELFRLAPVASESLKATEVSGVRPAVLPAGTPQLGLPGHLWQENRCSLPSAQILGCSPRQKLPAADGRWLYTEELPSLTPCCAQLVADNTCWHTVEAGESLWTIAQRYALDVATLKFLNQLVGTKPIIRPGQRLVTCTAALSSFAGEPALQ
jgi:membrane-bound lytic murein transglycosylase D